jgi:GNAT superfamily N-acetyltransferase
LKIIVEPNIDASICEEIEDNLNQYNMDITGHHSYAPLNVILRDDRDVVKGGALGGIWGGWLHLRILWVAEEARGQGYGRQLLAAVETEAVAAKCYGIYLETYDFQAYSFYTRYGFEVSGQLSDIPPGHTLYYLAKRFA